MGYKIAEEAFKRGHKVILISGPVNITAPKVNKFVQIETAVDLLETLKKEISSADCLIMCAAVSDFRIKKFSRNKIKKNRNLKLEFTENIDVLSQLTKHRKSSAKTIFAGFSLETENYRFNAQNKLQRKHLDIIAANKLTKYHNPFGCNKLDMDIIDKSGEIVSFKKVKKAFIANVLLDKIEKIWYLKDTAELTRNL